MARTDVGTAGPRVETPALNAGLETSEAPKVRLPRRTTAMCLPHIVCSGFRVFGPNVMDFTATGTTAGTIPTAATTHHAPRTTTTHPHPHPHPQKLCSQHRRTMLIRVVILPVGVVWRCGAKNLQ